MGQEKWTQYKNDYNKEHYARIGLYLSAEEKEEWDRYRSEHGYGSMAEFIKETVRKEIHGDKRPHEIDIR